MALIDFAGFESGTVESPTSSLLGTNSAVQTTTKRTGAYALRLDPSADADRVAFSAILSNGQQDASAGLGNSVWARAYFRIGTLPASASTFFAYGNGTNRIVDVRIDNTGAITLWNGTTSSATIATVTADGLWHRIDLVLANNASCTGSVDGSATQSVTGGNIAADKYFYCGSRLSSHTYDIYYDDIALWDADPSLGSDDIEVTLSAPDAAGNYATGFAAGTGSTFAEVDEIPPDTTTYIASQTVGDKMSFTYPNTGVTGTILALKAAVRARDAGAGGALQKIIIRSNGSEVTHSTDYGFGTSYVWQMLLAETDPSGGAAWTTARADAVDIGVHISTGGTTLMRQSAIYRMILARVTSGVTHSAAAVLAAAVTVGPTAGIRSQNAAVLAGAGTVSPQGNIRSQNAAVLAGAVTMSSDARATWEAAAALAAAATIAPAARATLGATATLAGTGAQDAAASVRSQNAAVLPGAATIAPAGGIRYAVDAILAGVVTLAAEGRNAATANAVLAAAGTMSAAAWLRLAAAAALPGTATQAGGAGVRSQNAASLPGTATMAAANNVRLQAAAAMLAAATFQADPHVTLEAAAALLAAAVLASTDTVYRPAAAAFAGSATLAGVGGFHLSAALSLTGLSGLNPAPKLTLRATVLLEGVGEMIPLGRLLLNAIQFDKAGGRAWALVYDVDDTTILGVLPYIAPAYTLRQINAAGYWEIHVPEADESADLLAYGRYIRIYYEGLGLRMRGIIEDWETPEATDGNIVRRVWGGSLAIELAFENTYQDIVFAGISAATAWAALLANAAGWTATATGSYNTQSGRYGYKSLLEAAGMFAPRAGAYYRETWTARQLELKNTHSDAGFVLGNLELGDPEIPAVTSIIPLRGTPAFRREGRVFNRIVPIGQGEQGNPVTLQQSTRVAPYTIQSRFVRRPRVSSYAGAIVITQDGYSATIQTFGENRYSIAAIVASAASSDVGDIGGQQMVNHIASSIIAAIGGRPPKGNPQLKMTFTIGSPSAGGIVSLEGVDQITPVAATASNSGSSTSPSVTIASNVNQLIIAFLTLRTINTYTVSSSNGTLVGRLPAGTGFDEDLVTCWSRDGQATNTTINWTISPSATWEAYAFALNPALSYYIEDATSIAAYGPGKPRVKVLSDITLTVDRIDDAVAIANQLYDYAVTVLTREKDPADIVIGQPAFLTDTQAQTVLPGDSLRLLFKGVVVTDTGTRLWKDFDATFIITSIKEVLAEGRPIFEFAIATVITKATGNWADEVGGIATDVDQLNTAAATRA